jgi:dTDP-4-dehydrorhamnose reductase
MQQRVWITGAGGLIGNYLVKVAAQFATWARPIPLRHPDLDITDEAAIRSRFVTDRPDAVIHCAAMSTSRGCQDHPALAHKVNVQATAALAEIARDVPILFFSTDLVFDGQQGRYREEDAVNPLSVYGETKLAGERIVLAHPDGLIIRTSLNCGDSPSGTRGLDEQLRAAFASGQTLRLFNDEFRCPIPAEATARAAWELLEKQQRGIFHIAGAERLSRFEIGSLLAARWPELNPKIEPASFKEYDGAPRTPDTSLDCAKASRILSFALPKLSEWVNSCLGASARLRPG